MRSGAKMRGFRFLALFPVLAAMLAYPAVMAADGLPAVAIQRVLVDQVAAWNRGDVDAFMQAYKNSPDTTFIGKSVQHGYATIRARYEKQYPGKDAMGTLDFSEITVRELGAGYAVVTGRFHLTRTPAGGGDASGIFSLVCEKTPEGWKIILDHTSSDKP